MSSGWLDVVLRIPVMFMLDFSLSFLPSYFPYSWPVCIAIQCICKYYPNFYKAIFL